MKSRQLRWLLMLFTGLFPLSGASCPKMLSNLSPNPLPRVLPLEPRLEQVIEVVNRNSSPIQSFSTNRASISGQGFPTLRASIAFERQKRFRLRADMPPMGTQLDVGSNDELFWFWAKEGKPQTLYFCRHEQYASSNARLAMPIDPQWLIEAFGVMEFDPNLPHKGPFTLAKDRLRIDTVRETPEGPVDKITILDGSQGWVLEQHQFDVKGQLVVSSFASQHRRDPLTGLAMPTVVQIECPRAQIKMRIDLGNLEINRLSGDPAALWSMPTYPGATIVNLADPNFQPPVATTTQRALPPSNDRRANR
jgi:hypothetical protein